MTRTTTTRTSKTTTKKATPGTEERALPKQAKQLSSLEENVLRMRQGLGVELDEPLPSNAYTPELAEKLRAIEARAFEMTGRAEAMRARQSSPKSKIVASLKRKG